MKRVQAAKVGLLLVAGASVFLAGRWSVRTSPGDASATCVEKPAVESGSTPKEPATKILVQRTLLTANVAAAASAARDTVPSSPQDPVGHAVESLRRLRRLVPVFHAEPAVELPSAAQRAQLTRPFVEGFAAALAGVDPSAVEAVASEVTESFCGKDPPKGDQRVMFAQLANSTPAVLTSEGLDCFLGQSKGTEDEGTWEMIQAWRASGMGKTAAITELEAKAQDPRTKNLFASTEQLAAIGETGAQAPAQPARTYSNSERTLAAQRDSKH
jgi:hypothetical protein